MVFLAKIELDRNAKFHLKNWRTSCFNKIRHFLGLEGSRLSGSVDNVLAKKPRTQDLNLVQRVLGSSIGYFFVIPCAFSKSVYGKSLKPPLVSCLRGTLLRYRENLRKSPSPGRIQGYDILITSQILHHGVKTTAQFSYFLLSALKKYRCITAAWFLF